MIRTDAEYKEAVRRLQDEETLIKRQGKSLEAEGYDKEAQKRLLDPILSFHVQLAEEIEQYERLRRGEFQELTNLRGMGQLLISLRIARNISQRDLAKKVDVNESQVSRDERNEYHNISTDRAMRILDALGVRLVSRVEALPDEPVPELISA